ncbi:hypothetical protein [Streptantibioticus ferralitis]|uniref:NADP-dependent oxidoreductase domain-containing protein n=1 Tax=Streptantibioticus ferralitis TaxID=236510 RepID=A0ABT5YV53_9ACTN|nr:hypothetical protein [Streptantibioticus ferralitis]MDF2255484.1 hypothetical protein [Streptantibioticus ferralitis]
MPARRAACTRAPGPTAGTPLWGRRGAGADRPTTRALFERFAEAGGNFVDTADCYQFGEAD